MFPYIALHSLGLLCKSLDELASPKEPVAPSGFKKNGGGEKELARLRILWVSKTDNPFVSKRNYSKRQRVDALQAQPESTLPQLPLLVCRADAATILGLPLRTFDKHVRPSLNARRIGRMIVFEKGETIRWAKGKERKARRVPAPQRPLKRKLYLSFLRQRHREEALDANARSSRG